MSVTIAQPRVAIAAASWHCAVARESLQPTAPPPNAIVEQPRPFGYVVGDLRDATRAAAVEGRAFEPAALPARRAHRRMARAARAAESNRLRDGRRWLVVDYQVINAPQALTTGDVAGVGAASASPGRDAEDRRVADQRRSADSAAAVRAGGLGELRPDRATRRSSRPQPMRRQIVIWSIALRRSRWRSGSAGAWRNWRAVSTPAFRARAARDSRASTRRAASLARAASRLRRTAGRVMQTRTLPTLFRRRPHLAPLRAEIERFFAQSGERFFGARAAGAVRCRCARCAPSCAEIEKRHER